MVVISIHVIKQGFGVALHSTESRFISANCIYTLTSVIKVVHSFVLTWSHVVLLTWIYTGARSGVGIEKHHYSYCLCLPKELTIL